MEDGTAAEGRRSRLRMKPNVGDTEERTEENDKDAEEDKED